MRVRSLPVFGPHGFRKLAYTEWGSPDNPRVVVCVHGLTRTGRDFDALAEALVGAPAGGWRVVCPDVAGRGQSEWLPSPQYYDFPLYMADMAALIARLDVPELTWIGTSMGGLIGMFLASQPNTPIRRLLLNDIGPFLPAAALAVIRDRLAPETLFPDLAGLETHLRLTLAEFGALTDDQWRHLAVTSARVAEDGTSLRLHYDPAIATRMRAGELADVDLWPVWDNLRCPMLVLRGENSQVLPAEVAAQMQRRAVACRVETIAGCGHAPALMDAAQIDLVRSWLGP